MKLWWDLETYSETPITAGSHRYAEKAEILLVAWAIDDGPVECWDCTARAQAPEYLKHAFAGADEYWGHNSSMFDRVVFDKCMPDLRIIMDFRKHRDTMVQALCHGLPGGLGDLCTIYRLPEDVAKNRKGRQLVSMFCKPDRTGKRNTAATRPNEWRQFIEYAKSDITSMRELHKKMPKWNYPNRSEELKLCQITHEMNNRGILMDTALSEKAVEAVQREQARFKTRVLESTGGAVESATQRDKMLEYILGEYGIALPDMRSDTLERRLNDTSLPYELRELIGLRLDASKSSVSKYNRVLKSVSADGYLRGTIQFSGAGRTGRDAGRLFQPQNLMRPTMPQEEIEAGIEAVMAGCADLVVENVVELCANAVRSLIIAPPGRKVVVADLSNIEGRVLAWLAGETWKLQAFRDFDEGKGADLYKIAYARAFHIPTGDVSSAMRQIGKVMELAMGYQGGVGAFVTFAAAYGIDLEKLPRDGVPADVRDEAEGFYAWSLEQKRPRFGLSREAFITCDCLKRMWRRAHPDTVRLWQATEESCVAATLDSHTIADIAGKIYAERKGNWLRVVLPSGRSLSYPNPRVTDGVLSFEGINQYTRKWGRITTYGGKLVENMTQAVARDVFKSSYPAILEAGYDIRLPVHDENITYAPEGMRYGPRQLSALMSVNPPWAAGLPLAAAGYEGQRYKKG